MLAFGSLLFAFIPAGDPSHLHPGRFVALFEGLYSIVHAKLRILLYINTLDLFSNIFRGM